MGWRCDRVMRKASSIVSSATAGAHANPVPDRAEELDDMPSSYMGDSLALSSLYRLISAGKRILVDGARLLRDLRNLLAEIHPDTDAYLHLPATIDALAHSKDPSSSLRSVVSPEITAPTFCTGYLPTCSTLLYQGAYYSVLCRDIAPFAHPDSLTRLAGNSTAWAAGYSQNPYLEVCGAWRVAPAAASITAPVASDVPVLAYSGELDPFATTEVVRAGLADLPNAFLVPGQVESHWVNGGLPPACSDDDSRNEFLADPTSAPNARCQEHFQPRFVNSPL